MLKYHIPAHTLLNCFRIQSGFRLRIDMLLSYDESLGCSSDSGWE